MANLLDYIFNNLEIDSLDRSQVMQYLSYLMEIDSQLPTEEDRIKFQSIKILLDKRLVGLDQQLVHTYYKNGLLVSHKKKKQQDSPE